MSEMQVLSNSYSAEYGGLAGVVVTTKRGASSYRGTGFFDFNNSGLNALTYNQTLAGVERGRSAVGHARAPVGRQHRRSALQQQAVLLRQLRRLQRQVDLRRRRCDGADRRHAQRRLPRHRDRATRSADRAGLPGPGDPSRPHRSGRAHDHGLLLSAAEPGHRWPTATASSSSSCPRRASGIAATSGSTIRLASNDSIFVRGSYQHRDPNAITFEAGNALTNMPILNAELNTASVDRRLDEDLLADDRQRVPRRLQLRQLTAREHFHGGGRGRAARASKMRPSLAADRRGFPSFKFTGVARTGRPTSPMPARNVDRTLRQNAFSISNNVTWIKGGHSLKGGGL